jgi:hypothetical protein
LKQAEELMMSTLATPPTINPTERRVTPRFQPAFGTICRLHIPGENGRTVVGLVWNISESGVSMLIADPPTRGAELDAELTTESGGDFLPVAIRVVHVREMPVGDYFVGAQFARHLEETELKRFLLPLPAPACTVAAKG